MSSTHILLLLLLLVGIVSAGYVEHRGQLFTAEAARERTRAAQPVSITVRHVTEAVRRLDDHGATCTTVDLSFGFGFHDLQDIADWETTFANRLTLLGYRVVRICDWSESTWHSDSPTVPKACTGHPLVELCWDT